MSEYAEFTDVDNDWTHERLVYYADQWMPYSSIYRRQNLGEEVRELRAKVQELTLKNELQYRELRYWRNNYDALAYAVALVVSLYGWGGNASYIDGLAHVRKDIEALRQRIRELKGR